MRWTKKPKKIKIKIKPHLGDMRVVRTFIWFPKSLGNNTVRWLETSYIRQYFSGVYVGGYSKGRWKDEKFVTVEEYDEYLYENIKVRRGIENLEDLYNEMA